MRSVLSVSALILTVLTQVAAVAQQAGQEAVAAVVSAVSAEAVSTCVDAQQRSLRLLEAINERVEMSRQTNGAAEMRAAMADVQRALLEARTELGRCATLAQLAAATDPHAGHTLMPTTTPARVAGASSASISTSGQPAKSSDKRQATQAQGTQASGTGSLNITFSSMPSPARGAAENQFEVAVKDRLGKPVNGADVSLLLYMPAMPSMKMPEIRNDVKLTSVGNGRYTGTGQVMIAGQWIVTISVKQSGREIGQEKVMVTAR